VNHTPAASSLSHKYMCLDFTLGEKVKGSCGTQTPGAFLFLPTDTDKMPKVD
jgi:hypothetical protein